MNDRDSLEPISTTARRTLEPRPEKRRPFSNGAGDRTAIETKAIGSERDRTAEGQSMVGKKRAEEYRRNASECRIQANRAVRPQDRASWLKIAAQWQDLADAAEMSGELTRPSRSRSRNDQVTGSAGNCDTSVGAD